MSTHLAQVLARLEAVCQQAAPSGCGVYSDRADAESRREAPCIELQPDGSPVESFSAEMDLHKLVVELRIHVRGDPATPLAEAIHAPVHTAITTDPVLADLCESRRLEDQTFTFAEADATALDKLCRYRFTYLISQTTL